MAYSLVDEQGNTLATGARPVRKLLITVAEWAPDPNTPSTTEREILGVRTEDSSIEFNLDTATSTDILGTTYTDLNKTEPQQSFDPFSITGGSKLAMYLTQNALENHIDAFNQRFDIYIITGFLKDSTKYFCVKHSGCSIYPTSIGGDAHVDFPIEVHLSNNITPGSVDKLDSSFTFTSV